MHSTVDHTTKCGEVSCQPRKTSAAIADEQMQFIGLHVMAVLALLRQLWQRLRGIVLPVDPTLHIRVYGAGELSIIVLHTCCQSSSRLVRTEL
jgi:hypothetical protein